MPIDRRAFAILDSMKHSPLMNYAGIPGLTSWKLGARDGDTGGMVRLFECSRDHHEPIIPHSHRFDFHCEVMSGHVRNVLWHRTARDTGDAFQESILRYADRPGEYDRTTGKIGHWCTRTTEYREGESYTMYAEQVHSIYFAKGTRVVFFEGPASRDSSIILEPVVHGEVIPTFHTPAWAFRPG